jgi:predicted Zn-dependent peptidase
MLSIGDGDGFAEQGGLIFYGPDPLAIYGRLATYVDRILRGTKPGEIPVEQPSKFELVVNLKTARAMGLDTGSMSGFDNAKVDAAFFPYNGWRSNWLINIGHGDEAGLRLHYHCVEAHALPLAHVRVVVGAGMSYGAPGVATVTAQMLKDGGTRSLAPAQLAERIEALGASLSVDTDFDRTTLGLVVTRDRLGDALALLGEIVGAPRFDDGELKNLKGRMSDEAEEHARASGAWAATRLSFRELYPTTSPYATYDATAPELGKVSSATVRAFHKKFFVAKNTTVIVGGDVDTAATTALVQKHFSGLGAADAPKLDFPAATAPGKRRVVLAARPGSVQSDVFVVGIAPERKTAAWPDLRVANQILGGGVASRLFMDVREQRSLAYSTRSQIVELAHGPQPLLAYAGTETKKTGLAVQGILDNYAKISAEAPSDAELDSATRYLSDIFAVRMETVGAVTDLVATQTTFGLPDGYWDAYREAVRHVDAKRAQAAAATLFSSEHALVVVSGDADVLAPKLTHFGEVVVVDPQQDFKTIRTLPEDPGASIE